MDMRWEVAKVGAYVYFVPSSMGSKSLHIAWYVNSWMRGATTSIARSVMTSVPRGLDGSDGFYMPKSQFPPPYHFPEEQ